jgi:hypothetical protein
MFPRLNFRLLLLGLVCAALCGGAANAKEACVAAPAPENPSPSDNLYDVPLTAGLSWTGPAAKLGAVEVPKAAKPAPGTRPYPKGVDAAAIPGGAGTKSSAKVAIPFFDSMESGTNGWSTTGFWHQITHPENLTISPEINPRLVHLPDAEGRLPSAYSGSTCWWYGEDSTGTFIGNDFWRGQEDASGGTSTGANSGFLISPSFDLGTATQATLSFKTWWEIEGVDVNAYDMMYVEASVDGGQTFQALGSGSINPANDVDGESWRPYSSGGLGEPGQWINVSFDLTPLAGHEVVVRFRFETHDELYNGFRGWFIDDVSVTGDSIPGPVIDLVLPPTGPKGALFYVHGANFVNGAVVLLGSTPCNTVVVGSSEAQVVVPQIPPGLYDVTLANPDPDGIGPLPAQSATAPGAFTVTQNPAPGITSIDPAQGPQDAVTSVVISGTNFKTGATASVAGVKLLNLLVNEGQGIILADVPAGLPVGFQNVQVTNPDGQFGSLIGGFQVLASCAVVYDVYLNGDLICGGTPYRSCQPQYLLENTWYQWQVVAKVVDSVGALVAETPGPVWSFLTESLEICPPPGRPSDPNPPDGTADVSTDPLLKWQVATSQMVAAKGSGDRDLPGAPVPPSPFKQSVNGELFTTTDNENNAGTGIADGDMDVYLFRYDNYTPIEFNIYWSGGSTPANVQLLLSAWDVDETSGEVDYVFFNGVQVGSMTGANDEWSTTVINIDPGLLQAGNNRVQVTIDEVYFDWWAITVDWGQLMIDGTTTGTANIRYAQTDRANYMSSDTVVGTVEVDTTISSQAVRVETNLIDPNGVNIAGTSRQYTTSGAQNDPFNVSLPIPAAWIEGTYVFQVLVYDQASALLQDTEFVPFTVGQCLPKYDVYLDGALILSDSPVTECRPSAQGVSLEPNRTYMWQVVAKNLSHQVTGPEWRFSTEDGTPPELALNGAPELTVECGGTYYEYGATATDDVDGDISGLVTIDGAVNTAVPGQYTLTYRVMDSAGNEAVPVTRTVTVEDTTPPVITLNGSPSETVVVGAGYTDPGATAWDACEGDLTGAIQVSGSVDTGLAGTYVLTYTVSDSFQNMRTEYRYVNVAPGNPPVITLLGNAVSMVECGHTYNDSGATAHDDEDGDLTGDIQVGGLPIDGSTSGTFIVTYDVTDSSGNPASTVVRTVVVEDTLPPNFALLGSETMTVSCASAFTDPGALAFDECTGDLADRILVDGWVNTGTPGAYVITYNVADSNGNPAGQLTRTVAVVDAEAPEVTLLGDPEITLACGEVFSDPGATAVDGCEGNLNHRVVATGLNALSEGGSHVLVYYAADLAGNRGMAVRTVHVPGDCSFDVCGVVRNSLTGRPVAGVYVELSADLDKAIAYTTTATDGSFLFDDDRWPLGAGPYMITFTRSEYIPQTVYGVSAPRCDVNVDLVPVGVTRPCRPLAISGPKNVYVSWAPNPEYNLKGYNVYRTEVDADGNPRGKAEKINGDPGDVYDALVTDVEYIDAAVVRGRYYIYQIQAISAADRPSLLSEPSDPPVKGEWLTVFFPEMVNWTNQYANAYLWNIGGIDKAVIPVCSRSVYEVSATSMDIVGLLPKALIQAEVDHMPDLEMSGVTAGMTASASLLPSADPNFWEVRISAGSADSRDLYGSGALFYLAFTPTYLGSCGDTILLEDVPPYQDGVRFYDDPWQPPLELDIENGVLCNEGGCLHGDANNDGAINAADAQWITDYWCKLASANACTPQSADINLDGKINAADSTLILRWINGLPMAPPSGLKAEDLANVSFAARTEKDGPPQATVGQATGQPGGTVNLPVTLSGGAPLAGFNMMVTYPAGINGLTFQPPVLSKDVFSKSVTMTVDSHVLGDKGYAIIAVGDVESMGKAGETTVITLVFQLPEEIAKGASGTFLPVNLAGFGVNDEYGFQPEFNAPAAPETNNGGVKIGVQAVMHSADPDQDFRVNLTELLRVIQFYNMRGFCCAASPEATEDGYLPGPGANHSCGAHSSDYLPQDWSINLSELLRLIQFFNIGGYHTAEEPTEDGFAPGLL